MNISDVYNRKTKENLLEEYREVKISPYVGIFGLPLLCALVILTKVYAPSFANFFVSVLCIIYVTFILFSYFSVLRKKIDILFEVASLKDK
jgi:hypothetical protein